MTTEYNLVLCGDSKVGKSSFVKRYVDGVFDEPDSGVTVYRLDDNELFNKDGSKVRFQRYVNGVVVNEDGNEVKYSYWVDTDTDSKTYKITFNTDKGKVVFNVQEHEYDFNNEIMKTADCCIILYDVTRYDTMHRIDYYRQLFRGYNHSDTADCVVVVGNKLDSPDGIFRYESGKLKSFLVSSKTGYYIDKPFVYLCEKLTDCNWSSIHKV
jgi:GTPase SAR1 family protein